MTRIFLILLGLLLAAVSTEAQITDSLNQQNAAFYAGESLNYILQPPPRFRMVEQEASMDGFSFAFIPEQAIYTSTDVLIGINIFKSRGLIFEEVVRGDTTTMRDHYGDSLQMWPVDSVLMGSGQVLPTFYVNDRTRFIPNVMIAYLDGGTELIIFELIINDKARRVEAEQSFIDCLRNSKALERRQLGAK